MIGEAKMSVILGKGYIFSAEDGNILSGVDVVHHIRGIRNDILQLLISKEGEYVCRSDIVKSIWGKDDLSIYNASLTQQVYLLRKDLKILGLDERLISNSRQGYKYIIPNEEYDDETHPNTQSTIEKSIADKDLVGFNIRKKILISISFLLLANIALISYIAREILNSVR